MSYSGAVQNVKMIYMYVIPSRYLDRNGEVNRSLIIRFGQVLKGRHTVQTLNKLVCHS